MKLSEISTKKNKICLIASKVDKASMTIANEIENLGLKVFYLEKSHLYCNNNDLPKDFSVNVILSRHSSSTGNPAFTVHSTGNFSSEPPKLGGQPSTLCFTNADVQSDLLRMLFIAKDSSKFQNFQVIAEATHHGPLLSSPTIYIEMGSTDEIWSNKNCGMVIANAIESYLREKTQNKRKTAIALGGTHYPQKFTNLMISEEYSIGHICPKYAFEHLTTELINEMVLKTISQTDVKFAILEKKGMKRKKEIKEILIDLNLELVQV